LHFITSTRTLLHYRHLNYSNTDITKPVSSPIWCSLVVRLRRTVVARTVFAEEAEFVGTFLIIPCVAFIGPDIDARLASSSPIKPVRFAFIPLRVAHRTYTATIHGPFPHKVGFDVRVNTLPCRPHIGSLVINAAPRLQLSCTQTH